MSANCCIYIYKYITIFVRLCICLYSPLHTTPYHHHHHHLFHIPVRSSVEARFPVATRLPLLSSDALRLNPVRGAAGARYTNAVGRSVVARVSCYHRHRGRRGAHPRILWLYSPCAAVFVSVSRLETVQPPTSVVSRGPSRAFVCIIISE